MTVGFVGSQRRTGTATGVEPAGAAPEDTLVAITGNDNGALAPPAGWSQVAAELTGGGANTTSQVWLTRRGSSAPDLTWTGTLSTPSVHIAAWRGAQPDPVATAEGTAGSATAPAVTATAPGQLLVCLYSDSFWQAIGVPAGMTDRSDSTGSDASLIADEIVGAPGSTGIRTFTGNTPSGAWSMILAPLLPPPPPPANPALLRTIEGSQRPVFDARVVSTFQTGDDPDGETIPIIDGEVTLDGSAEIRGTLSLTTAGINKATGVSRFPRGTETLLAPYGNEVFVRRGVDLGGAGLLWVPLGYYRIDTTEQPDGPYGAIALTGSDRMATIRDSDLLEPRQYIAGTTIGAIFIDLVGEVYPGASIAFDDGSDLAALGRALIVEESRYEALANLADALGKIMFWDGEGILRVETAPDPTEVVWEVNAGRDGVLVRPSRRLTREGVYNAVVARGEGGDEVDPVVGIATDDNPNSPTRFGGRFGRVPRYFASSFLTTTAQAQNAAQRMLLRGAGLSYSADFGAVVNPALKPFEAVRVEQRDFNRETHVMDTVKIPLIYDAAMTGTTRDHTFLTVGGS